MIMSDDVLVKTFSQILATRTGWSWRPDGAAYSADEVGIFYGALSPSPDRAVGVTAYASTDDLETSLATRRVQLRFRGLPGDRSGADAMAGTAFHAMQGLARVAGISLVSRVMFAQLGADDNDRQERTDSYQVLLDNPEA